MKYEPCIIWFLIILISCPSWAQDENATNSQIKAKKNIDEAQWRIMTDTYGSFRGHFAVFNDEMEIQGNASRIGTQLTYRFDQDNRKKIFIHAEFGVLLFEGGTNFNTDARTASGFLTLEVANETQVLRTRLGYIGLDLHKAGQLTFGKQWSTYYDITGYTDKYNVFGGQGSNTYVADTDGGDMGTGRADNTIIYRNTLRGFKLGVQMQFLEANNDAFVDGLGASLQYSLQRSLTLGAAYNIRFYSPFVKENVIGLHGNGSYFVLGANYQSKYWDVGLIYANQYNGDLARVIDSLTLDGSGSNPIVFDASGIEFSAKYSLMDHKWVLIGGYNYLNPNTQKEQQLESSFGINYLVLGAEYHIIPEGLVYAEARLPTSDNTSENGIMMTSVATLGLKLDFRFKTYHHGVKE